MKTDVFQELTAEYSELRAQNEATEQAHREQALQQIPELVNVLAERENLIFSGIRRMLAGQAAADNIPARMDACNQEVTRLLTSHGFAANWLEPIYRCPQCRDTGYTGEPVREMCPCFRQRYQQRLTDSFGLAGGEEQSYENWNSSLFSDTITHPRTGISQKNYMEALRRDTMSWTEAWPDTPVKTILLSGMSGLGKTYAMNCMVKKLLQKGVNVMIVSAYKLLDLSRKAYFSGKSDEFDSLMAADVLMIDDLGSEPLFDNVTVTQFFNILNERLTEGRSTVFSTNLSLREIRERYTERVASRLSDAQTARIFNLFGDDLRRTAKKEPK